ncbi:hypothetical protein [Photobacterium sp. TY1-4]|uniref:hypothetical protein n=1 Tax=Photobacterium sp. TY1-4 TaxID=2899122 RepID=UPI0021C197A0|nr:hypothetical protein [Photobacterium sp. TY1-4]UXI03217.1 hypothetical protein NH461_22535 [Photobacterium sp. TY1-4]
MEMKRAEMRGNSGMKESAASQPGLAFGYAEPALDPLLQYSVRQQLEALTKEKLTDWQRRCLLRESFTETITTVLQQEKTDHQTLTRLFENMYQCAVQSMALAGLSQEVLTRQYIGSTGLVMSPLNCRTTIQDIYRVKGFTRGIDQAIRAKLAHKESIHILYPACGPFAPLMLPLLQYYQEKAVFSSEQIQLTLVDVQPGAIQTLHQLVSDLGLDAYVAQLAEADATAFQPEQSFDLLILEAMQHGFTKEGQLSIAKHLVPFLSVDGSLIPAEISVRGMLVHGETEFNQQWQTAKYAHSDNISEQAQADRVELGEIFKITKSSLLGMAEIELQSGVKVIRANQVKIPSGVADMKDRILAIYAHIETFAGESVGPYDSGITHPCPDMSFYVDMQPRVTSSQNFVVRSGETVQFYYQLTGLPGFVATKG